MKKKMASEFKNFDNAMHSLMKVSYSDVKKKLNEEKEAKKRQKLKVSDASREAV